MPKQRNFKLFLAIIFSLALVLLSGVPSVLWDTYNSNDTVISQQADWEIQAGDLYETGVFIAADQDLLIGIQSLSDGVDFGKLKFCQQAISDTKWRQVKLDQVYEQDFLIARSKTFSKKSKKKNKKIKKEDFLFISAAPASAGDVYLLTGVKKKKLNSSNLKKIFNKASSEYCGNYGEEYYNRAAEGELVPQDTDINMPLEVELEAAANGNQVFIRGLNGGEYQLYLGTKEQGKSERSYRSGKHNNWTSVNQVIVTSEEEAPTPAPPPVNNPGFGNPANNNAGNNNQAGAPANGAADDFGMPSYIKSLPEDSPLRNKYCNRKRCEWLDAEDLRRYSGSGPVMDDRLNEGKQKAQCSTDSDCTYNKCDGDQCVSEAVFGGEEKKEDECVITPNYPEGNACIHSACEDNQCKPQQGPGEVECRSHDDCGPYGSSGM